METFFASQYKFVKLAYDFLPPEFDSNEHLFTLEDYPCVFPHLLHIWKTEGYDTDRIEEDLFFGPGAKWHTANRNHADDSTAER